jgi:two-component system KDP operon response regulator KdpE
MSDNPRVLIIDDELAIRRLLARTLEASGYTVLLAETAAEGLRQAGMERPDLVILDLGLPDLDGLRVLKELRTWSELPVLILSVRSGEEDIVTCLHAGADDYLIKPFGSGELLARVQTALRHRPSSLAEPSLTTGTLSVDLAARTVTRSGVPVKLTPTEFKLLALLVRNAGKVLTHRYILEQVWGPAFVEESEYTRVYVGQLRKKIEDDPGRPKILLTESGIGYRLVVV